MKINNNIKISGNFGGLLMSVLLILVIAILIFLIIPISIIHEEKVKIEEQENALKQETPTPIKIIPQEEYIPIKEAGSSALLKSHTWVPQTFNNCGPATASMVLQDFGYTISQAEIKQALRTNPDDRNVFLYEISDYIKNGYQVESKILQNGNIDTLKILLANGFYIVPESWLHPGEDIGHFSILIGYDDENGVLIFDDSYLGLGLQSEYQEFDEEQWKAFNRTYMVVYDKKDEKIVKKIIGEDWNETTMLQNALLKNLEDIKNNPNDVYALFNLGTSYYALSKYQEAWQAFQTAEEIGWPHRMLWYQIEPVQSANSAGEYQKAIELADEGLDNNNSFAELHYEKSIAYQGLRNIEKAKEELNLTLKYAPNYKGVKELLELL